MYLGKRPERKGIIDKGGTNVRKGSLASPFAMGQSIPMSEIENTEGVRKYDEHIRRFKERR